VGKHKVNNIVIEKTNVMIY